MAPAALNFIENAVSKGIPKFLYHITTKKNYRAIMKDGFLRTTADNLYGEGIFTIDLVNFFKRWQDVIYKDTGENYAELLLRHVSKKRNKIVICKIPTSKLQYDKLTIRSQNRLNDFTQSDFVYCNAIPEAKTIATVFQRGMHRTEEQDLFKTFLKESLKEHNIPDVEHCIYGAPVKEAFKYEQAKEAIEYIYNDNIPVSNIEKIGEVDLMWKMITGKSKDKTPLKSIFSTMLKNTSEAEATELLNC